MRKFWFIAALLLGFGVTAGTIRTWSNGETLTAADLNGNFSHIHNLMVGGHGARLVNADVSASAQIATSKLAGYRLLPRAWALLANSAAGCGTAVAACTETSVGGLTVVGAGAGVYLVNLGYTAADATYAVNISVMGAATAGHHVCEVATTGTTSFDVRCKIVAAVGVQTLTDVGFTVVVYDDN